MPCFVFACRVPCLSSRLWRWTEGPQGGRPQRRAPLPWAARSRKAPVSLSSSGRRMGEPQLSATQLQWMKTTLQVHLSVSVATRLSSPVCLLATCLPSPFCSCPCLSPHLSCLSFYTHMTFSPPDCLNLAVPVPTCMSSSACLSSHLHLCPHLSALLCCLCYLPSLCLCTGQVLFLISFFSVNELFSDFPFCVFDESASSCFLQCVWGVCGWVCVFSASHLP